MLMAIILLAAPAAFVFIIILASFSVVDDFTSFRSCFLLFSSSEEDVELVAVVEDTFETREALGGRIFLDPAFEEDD